MAKVMTKEGQPASRTPPEHLVFPSSATPLDEQLLLRAHNATYLVEGQSPVRIRKLVAKETDQPKSSGPPLSTQIRSTAHYARKQLLAGFNFRFRGLIFFSP